MTRAAARHTPALSLDVHPLPPLLHNHPERIAPAVEDLLNQLQDRYERVAIGYSDCGSYGAIDDLCERRGVARLPGLHCYDLYAGEDRIRQLLDEAPGTYLLTDFLVRSFRRTVWAELGLDRHPELHADYFRHYTRCVWLAQEPDEELSERAREAADLLGLPLEVVVTGHDLLDDALVRLVHESVPAESV